MKLTQETIAKINLFEKITRAGVKDCFEEENLLVFLVQEGQIQRAIGKNGANIKRLEGLFKRKIKVLGFASDPVKFINNLLYPVRADKVELGDGEVIITAADSSVKGKIFGRSKSNLARIKEMLKKYHNINEVKVI